MEFDNKVRGLRRGTFKDAYGHECSIQDSSIASYDAIWLGLNDASPEIMARDARKLGMPVDKDYGWMEYPVPKEVCMHTRMHLNREQVKALIPLLQHFVEHGTLPS